MQTGDPQALRFFNREASVTTNDGQRCALSEADFRDLNAGNYWHNREDPSTWLCAATVSKAAGKFRAVLSRAQIIELCAQTLNLTADKLESSLDWNANYMAFHDGMSVEETHVLPREYHTGT
jgi:hypothetical protein